ncbi:MAG: sialate O-acetylesterase [Planctomycetota bacterium]|nr:sialate O-acetylesterase [Planctomycetota bacterium]
MMRLTSLFFFLLCLPATANAELRLPAFFSDHMVLQQGKPLSVWGWADPGKQVELKFKGDSIQTETNAQGRWTATLPPQDASSIGTELTIQTVDKTIVITDVLVGEVWFASGQSNMVFSMNRVPDYQSIIESANEPSIRFFNASQVTAVKPQTDIEGKWQLTTPSSIGGFSAVAYFFAKKLHEELDLPIGIIKSAWGGKPVETFTSRTALSTLSPTKRLVEAAVSADANFDPKRAKIAYEARLAKWKIADEAWKKKSADTRGRRPRRPQLGKRPLETEGQPGVLFNAMINPFVGYTLQGAIWYQGEANAKPGAVPYDQTLPLLIKDWRHRWKDDFSFYFVQLANFRQPSPEPGNNDPWPLLQDRMRRILETTAGTGMAVINDVGEANDIHPKNKHDVGRRLALWALAKDYNQKRVYSGPLFQEAKIKNGSIEVRFNHTGKGLKARDHQPLRRFEIAGKDGVWKWAKAEIIAPDTVSISSDEVDRPVAVRYAWAANPEGANLVNSEGLPTSVFRTDDWEDVSPNPR